MGMQLAPLEVWDWIGCSIKGLSLSPPPLKCIWMTGQGKGPSVFVISCVATESPAPALCPIPVSPGASDGESVVNSKACSKVLGLLLRRNGETPLDLEVFRVTWGCNLGHLSLTQDEVKSVCLCSFYPSVISETHTPSMQREENHKDPCLSLFRTL